MIRFTLSVAPVAKGRPRLGRGGRVYTPDETRRFENEVRMLARLYKPEQPWAGPIGICLKFSLPKPKRPKCNEPICRPDLDNYVKAVLDALDEFWIDDSQVVHLSATKEYGEPEINVMIVRIAEENEEQERVWQ